MRGHHLYKTEWNPIIGEELCCLAEEDNAFDHFAVAISKDGRIVGHVPLLYLPNNRCMHEDDQKSTAKDWLFRVFTSSAARQNHLKKLIAIFRAQVRLLLFLQESFLCCLT